MIIASSGKFLPEGVEESEYFEKGHFRSELPLKKMLVKGDFVVAISPFVHDAVDTLLSGITGTIYEELSRLKYLGPLRSYPPRSWHFHNITIQIGFRWRLCLGCVLRILKFASQSMIGCRILIVFKNHMNW